jgi:hypothetical protein
MIDQLPRKADNPISGDESFLIRLLRTIAQDFKGSEGGWISATRCEYILEHGHFWTRQRRPRDYAGIRLISCYEHNQHWAYDGFGRAYVEGYAIPAGKKVVHPHAWLVDLDGKVIDCNWGRIGNAYFGVRFDPEEFSKIYLQRITGQRPAGEIIDADFLRKRGLISG